MPSRNIVREFVPNSYYHVYNRGVEKRVIFNDEQDYTVFLGLLKKYITGKKPDNKNRHGFKNFQTELSLLSYCLMPNHFHLLLHQSSEKAVLDFMRRLSTGYVMYFNNRYQRVGGLFQGPYRASRINADEYLHHISRYIHLNPEKYQQWPYSSFSVYQDKKRISWVNTQPVLELFGGGTKEYLDFVADYESSQKELNDLKWQLANDID